jgi:hypothetical protein
MQIPARSFGRELAGSPRRFSIPPYSSPVGRKGVRFLLAGLAAVYGHNFTPPFQAAFREWSDARGIPLVSIGYRNEWVDRH